MISDGYNEIDFGVEKEGIVVHLLSNQFSEKNLELLPEFLEGKSGFLGGTYEKEDKKLKLEFKFPENSRRLVNVIGRMSELERLEVAATFGSIFKQDNSLAHPFIHPENIVLVGKKVFLAYRGVSEIIEPKNVDGEMLLKWYKAMVIYMVNPSLDYSKLVGGSLSMRDKFSKKIYEATSISEVEKLVSEQYQGALNIKNRTEKSVKRSRYNLFKWGFFALVVVAVSVGVVAGITFSKTLPLKNRIIESSGAFVSDDYGKATDALKDDAPEKLPTSALYILANSYIHLDNLTTEQKDAVLKNISQNTDKNTLLYWIYLGRGDLEKAKDLAENVGDNQLILHAYMKLYDATKDNVNMKGSTKQKLLSDYEKNIKDLTKKLEGKTDEAE
jgi:type VII secretion protein EssB